MHALEVGALSGGVRLAGKQNVLLLALGGILANVAGEALGVAGAAGARGDGPAGDTGAATRIAMIAFACMRRGTAVGARWARAGLPSPWRALGVEFGARAATTRRWAIVHSGERRGVCSG